MTLAWFLARHLLFTIALGLFCLFVGARLLGWRRPDQPPERSPERSPEQGNDAPIERAALATGIGLGALGHLAMLLGLLGRLDARSVGIAVALVAAACCVPRPPVLGWARRGPVRPGLDRRKHRATAIGVAIVVATVALATWALVLYPPFQWDATSYHLPAAGAFAAGHRVGVTEHLRYPVFARHAEMLFSVALLFGDERDAQAVEWLMLAVTAAGLVGAGRRCFSRRAGAWAAALWVGSPLVLSLGTIAYVDAGLAMFVTLAAVTLLRWRDHEERGLLVAAAALVGFAASTKYSGLAFAAILGGLVLARRRAKDVLLFALVVAFVGSPWYLFNAWHSGNPLFPALGERLGLGGWWTPQDVAGQMQDLRSYGPGRSVGALLLLPFRLAFRQHLFRVEAPLSPLFLLGLPALALAAVDRRARAVFAIVVAWTVMWFASAQVIRYLVPVLPLLALAIAAALDRVAARWRWARHRLTALLVAAALAGQGMEWTENQLVSRGPPPSSPASRDAWLGARLPAFAAFRWFTSHAPPDARLYQLEMEDLTWFADGRSLGDWFGPERYETVLALLDDPRALHAALRRRGAGWLVAPRPAFRGHVRFPVEDPAFAGRFTLRFENDAAALYELAPDPGG